MLTDLIYIVEHRSAPDLLDGHGTAFELVLPRLLFSIDPDTLSGRRIWVVSRKGAEDVLALVGVVEGVAEIEENHIKGDLLLELDKRRSFRTVSGEREHRPWEISDLASFPVGLGECDDRLEQSLEKVIRHNLSTKLVLPPIRAIQRNWEPSDGISPLAHELVRINGLKPLDTLSSYRTLVPLSPIGAEVFISFTTSDENKSALVDAILTLDPLVVSSGSPPPSLQPRCDTSLLPLDPERIFARKYRHKECLLDIRLGLEKTEAAEKFHQSLLRRIAKGLIALGIQPLATRSLDLAFTISGTTYIIEIKTAYRENHISQFLKGISQLLYYEAEMNLSNPGIYRSCILIGSEMDLSSPETHLAILKRANINLFSVVASANDESPLLEPAKRLLEALTC